MVIIITSLIAIFTIGLGDESENNSEQQNRISTYSVFNRGFQRLLGSVDADALLAQHVGGGIGLGGVAAGNFMMGGDDGDGGMRIQHNVDDIDRQPAHRRGGGGGMGGGGGFFSIPSSQNAGQGFGGGGQGGGGIGGSVTKIPDSKIV